MRDKIVILRINEFKQIFKNIAQQAKIHLKIKFESSKMKKILNQSLILAPLIASAANDNPFINAKEANTTVIAPEAFERKEFAFPSDARLIKSVNISYIALDGSEKNLSFDVGASMDWHDTFVIAKVTKVASSPNLDVSVTLPAQSAEINSTLNIEAHLDSGKIGDFLGYTTYAKRVKIASEDEIISDFVIGDPSKIVLDFKKDIAFPTQTLRLNQDSAFQRLQVGSHKGYYRLVLYLDGKYDYSLEKTAGGYILSLK